MNVFWLLSFVTTGCEELYGILVLVDGEVDPTLICWW